MVLGRKGWWGRTREKRWKPPVRGEGGIILVESEQSKPIVKPAPLGPAVELLSNGSSGLAVRRVA